MFENHRISMQSVKLIGELDEFKGSWQSISAISPERLATLKHVATIESIGSSTRIEGSSLSNDEARDENGRTLGIIFATASPFDTPFKMTALFEWLNTEIEKKEIHPLFIAGVFNVCFLAIHPFQDGNGRLSRCLTTLLLLKFGYLYVPYSSLESVIEANKENYYAALRQTQTTLETQEPNWEPWLIFFFKAMQKQKNKLKEKIERAQILQGDLPSLSIKILELVREQGSVKSSDLVILTGESRSTVLARVNELVVNGKLRRNGKGPATWYTLPRQLF